MKGYNHALNNVIEACGFAQEETDKCLEGAITLHDKCDCTSAFVEELEKMITNGKFPTFTRFIAMLAARGLRSQVAETRKKDVFSELLSKMKMSDSIKVITLGEGDIPEELLSLLTRKDTGKVTKKGKKIKTENEEEGGK
jgi:hypothetical protein